MKALLVNPAPRDTLWSLKHFVKAYRKKGFYPPLGLLTVAALMPSDWDLRLVDMTTQGLRMDFLEWADMVFVGGMIVQRESVIEVVKSCHVAGKPVVAGGPLFTSNPQEFGDVDYLVLNEAEVTFPDFLHDLAFGRPRHLYSTTKKPDLALTPLPRWDLVNIHEYLSSTVQCSRGCPFNCEFCDITNLYGRTPRVKSPEQMIRELAAVHSTGWRGRLFVCDDNFIGNKREIKKVLKAISAWQQEHDYPFELHTQASIDLAADEELLDLMSSAGFEIVLVGLESPVQESLEEAGKVQNQGKDMIAAVRSIQNHGIEVMGSLVIGFDSDPPDVFERQVDFVQQSGIVVIALNLLNAFPGTRLYHRLEQEGRLVGPPSGDHSDGSVNFVPKLDGGTLTRKYNQTLDLLYSPKAFYSRMLLFLKHFQPFQRKRWDLVFGLTLIASVLYGGMLEKGDGKRFFWRALVRTLIFHKGALWKMTSNSVMGYHLRKQLFSRSGHGGGIQGSRAEGKPQC